MRGLARAGFADIRQTHGAVFQHVGIGGSQGRQMAKRAHMTKQSMAELVLYLEARGYVERVPDPADRRARVVRAEGMDQLRSQLEALMERWAAGATAGTATSRRRGKGLGFAESPSSCSRARPAVLPTQSNRGGRALARFCHQRVHRRTCASCCGAYRCPRSCSMSAPAAA